MSAIGYDLGIDGIVLGTIDLLADDIIILLVSVAYVRDPINDQFIAAAIGAAEVARSGPLQSKTFAHRVFDAADLTGATAIPSVTGADVTQVVLAKDTGSDATSPLIGTWDSGTGLILVPDGTDVSVIFSNGASKIFRIKAA